jgi:ribonuclease HII
VIDRPADERPGSPDIDPGPEDAGTRPRSRLAYEERLWGRGVSTVAGIDEVGRGPLAGPVIAAAVILPRGCAIDGAGDSKTLPSIRRMRIAEEIRLRALAVGIGAASVREIDTLNIAHATALAMRRALRALPLEPDHVVVDGLPVRSLGREHEAVINGDGLVHTVGCASIVAKVFRDALMVRLANRYPGYGWSRNKGYGTPEHLSALRSLGPCAHHRRTFCAGQLRLEV